MMPVYPISIAGWDLDVDADSKAKAEGIARLFIAREESVGAAERGARARSDKGLDDPLSPEFQALRAEGERRGTAEAGPIAAEMLASTALLGGAGMGVARLAAGARGLPIIGKAVQVATSRPGAAVIGAAEEGIRTGDPIEAAKGALLGAALGRTRGPVGRAVSMAERIAPAEAAAAPVAARTASTAPAAVAEAAPAVSAARAEADKIAAQLIRWKESGMSGGQMTSALQQVFGVKMKDATQMVKLLNQPAAAAEAKAVVSGLQAPRVEIGAQNVGRAVGMTKEQVRKAAGPVLGEALGEASPILPKQALKSIIDTMRKIPPGPAREAYVARATSGKAQWQVENIRRTLEHLGLLAPVGVVAAAESQ